MEKPVEGQQLKVGKYAIQVHPVWLFIAPWIIMGSIALGYFAAWKYSVPVDPRAVDEVRQQMGVLRKEMILAGINSIDVKDCTLRRWEMTGEFVPFIVVIAENCGKKKK